MDVVGLEELGGILLGGTTNLTDHDDTVGLGVLEEDLEAVNEVGAGEGVTTDTDDERLTETSEGGLVHGLVGQGTGTGDDTDTTALVDEAGHDTDLALTGSDDTRAVRTDQAGLVLGLKNVGDADHVVLGDTLSNANNEAHLSSDGLLDTGSGKRGGTKMAEAVAPVSFTASLTLAKTGRSRCMVPAFLGLVPPTTFVP